MAERVELAQVIIQLRQELSAVMRDGGRMNWPSALTHTTGSQQSSPKLRSPSNSAYITINRTYPPLTQ